MRFECGEGSAAEDVAQRGGEGPLGLHLGHTRWAHRPHRIDEESPLGLTEAPKRAKWARVGLGS